MHVELLKNSQSKEAEEINVGERNIQNEMQGEEEKDTKINLDDRLRVHKIISFEE